MTGLIAMSQAVACDSHFVAGASQLLKITCRRTHVKKPVMLSSRTVYIMKCIQYMVDHIQQQCVLRPWNQCKSVYLHQRLHIWNSLSGGASHQEKETPAWTKAGLSSSGRSDWKTSRPTGKGRGSHIWVPRQSVRLLLQGIHLLGRLQHLLRNLITDIGALGDVSSMTGHKHVVVVLGAGPVPGTSPLERLVIDFPNLSQNNWLRRTW